MFKIFFSGTTGLNMLIFIMKHP